MSDRPWLANSKSWGLRGPVLASIDEFDTMDLEALELYERGRQALSRVSGEESDQ